MTVVGGPVPGSPDPLARWKLAGAIATAIIVLLIPLSLVVLPEPGAKTRAEKVGPSFVGRERCAPCHEAATRAWIGSDHDLAMAEARMTLDYRVPDKQRLEWAERIAAEIPEDGIPKDQKQVYAREQLILHERQSTEIVIQGLRIGDIGIATTPNETYAITGLKIKAASPLKHNLVIELANGGDGYIPPPEQHRFGGYNTWPARSASRS